jgi:hypothetical protein
VIAIIASLMTGLLIHAAGARKQIAAMFLLAAARDKGSLLIAAGRRGRVRAARVGHGAVT